MFDPLLAEVLPLFAIELDRALRGVGEGALADQVKNLRYVSPCGCGDDFCTSFYTGDSPSGQWGPQHRCVGLIGVNVVAVDVVAEEIRYVEVNGRMDLIDFRDAFKRL